MIDDKTVAAMAERIIRQIRPERILLFGSFARHNAGPGSDVDLLVVMPDATDRRRAAVEIRRLLKDFAVSKDIVVTTPEEIRRRGDLIGTVLYSALREGQRLYERS